MRILNIIAKAQKPTTGKSVVDCQLEYIKEQNKVHIIITPHIGEASRLLKKDILQVKETSY